MRKNLFLAALGLVALAAAAPPTSVITEYKVPTTDAFPEDIAVSSKGLVYFTEMKANKIGRFDPATTKFTEFDVPTPDSQPSGIVVTRDGIIYFTEIRANKVARFDPDAHAFHEFNSIGLDRPHTPVVAPDGKVFFTSAGSDAIGRLDPATGAVTAFAVPTSDSIPYGIKLGPDDALYFTEFGSNKIGRFDLKTHRMNEFATPTPNSSPRRLWFLGDDLYFTEYSSGQLGRFNVRTYVIKEWLLPGGSGSMPYGIAVDNSGIVWCEEAANGRLVRFDPKRDRFGTTMPLLPTTAVVSKMDVGPDGRIWMALGGIDRIAALAPVP
jgi:virginiamycin B lyase